MSREALVVGINSYPLLKDSSSSTARHLKTAATDAEAIAQLLEEHGKFNVQRLPSSYKNGKSYIEPSPKPWELLKTADLEKAITRLYDPPSKTVPDTALLFFAGHGLRKIQGSVSEGFLASSDVCPSTGSWGISLRWLRRLVKNSPIKQQIIWLDCCYSGELLNFSEADPGNLIKRDRCFIAASREFEEAYEQISQNSGILTNMLVQAIDPNRQELGWVSNYTLVDFIKQQSINSPQRPIFHNSGSEIILTGNPEKIDKALLDTKVCPYKGLSSFEFNEEDPKYFYGRTALTDQLIEQVRESNFLAVVGISGSGKSSLVKAGLLHQLQLGQRLSGSNQWKVKILRPGKNPLHNLAKVFVETEQPFGQHTLQGSNYHQRLNEAKNILRTGAVGFSTLVEKEAQGSRLVLVIDQFEESFTLCKDEPIRHSFFSCILDSLITLQKRICLIITMRADFFGKCSEKEYSGLATLIQKNLVTVTPMTEDNLQQAIVQPATQVGLEIERELVEQMIADVEGSASLPLLQFTLTELWRSRKVERLTVAQYSQLGGVKGTLERQAEATYQSLSSKSKQAAKHIFINLIQLGEGTEDTRRRVTISSLKAPKYRKVFNSTIEILIKARLLVTITSEGNPLSLNAGEELEEKRQYDNISNKEISVEIVHEALIRNWETLRLWLDTNRTQIGLMRELERKSQEWHLVPSKLRDDFLLSEAELLKYNELYIDLADQLTIEVSRFVETSIQTIKKRKEEEIKRQEKEFDSEIKYFVKASEALLLSEQSLDALILTLIAGKKVQRSHLKVQEKTKLKVVGTIQNTFSNISEFNRLEGHSDKVNKVVFSPDGCTIATASEDKTSKLWNLQGRLLCTIDGHEDAISGVVFSPDNQTIATASNDATAKLWSNTGELLYTLRGHKRDVRSVTFSPDGQVIATASWDKTVKLWDREGQLITTFNDNDNITEDIVFSPDSKIVALNGKNPYLSHDDTNNTVKLWNLEGKPICVLEGHTSFVSGVAFSPDGQTIATASCDGTAMLWNYRGKQLRVFEGHTQEVNRVLFSPDSQIVASWSQDRTIRLWSTRNSGSLVLDGINPSTGVSFTPDSQAIASASGGGIVKIWNMKGELLCQLKGHTDAVNNVEFSPDGAILISSSDDKSVKFWNVTARPNISLDGTRHIKFHRKGGNLCLTGGYSASHDSGLLELWNAQGKLIQRIITHPHPFSPVEWINSSENINEHFLRIIKNSTRTVCSMDISADGKTIASADTTGVIKLWSRQGNLLTTIESRAYEINKLLFNPNGKTIVATSSYFSSPTSGLYDQLKTTENRVGIDESIYKTVQLWSTEGELIKNLEHEKQVTDILFSPDGGILASASYNGVIKLWSQTGDLLFSLGHNDGGVSSLAASPDGELFVSTGSNGTIKLWNWTGNLIRTFNGHDDQVNSVAFSPTNEIVVSVSDDKTINIWNLQGQLIRSLKEHTRKVKKVVFSPDGKVIVSIGDDFTIRFWSSNGELIHSIKDINYGKIEDMQISPDGQTLCIVKGCLKLWSLNLEEVMIRGHSWVRDYLANNPNASEEARSIYDYS